MVLDIILWLGDIKFKKDYKLFKGDTFDEGGRYDATITFHLCEYGADEAGVIKASSKKGKI